MNFRALPSWEICCVEDLSNRFFASLLPHRADYWGWSLMVLWARTLFSVGSLGASMAARHLWRRQGSEMIVCTLKKLKEVVHVSRDLSESHGCLNWPECWGTRTQNPVTVLKMNFHKVKLLQFSLICRRIIAVGAWGISDVQIFVDDKSVP